MKMSKKTTTCNECGDEFEYLESTCAGKYCSRKCYISASKNRVKCECNECGNIFEEVPSLIERGQGKYCSQECYHLGKRNKVERECEQCGDIFEVRPSNIEQGEGKYCSRECTNLGRRNRVECKCQQCGKVFESYPSDIKQGKGKHCSRKCMGLAKRGESYNEDSRSYGSDWPQIREEIIERDSEQCQECGKRREECDRDLHVHHIKPWVKFGDTVDERNQKAHYPENLITLCASCHRKIESQ